MTNDEKGIKLRFRGKRLENGLMYGILRGDLGKEVLRKYYRVVQKEFEDNPLLEVFMIEEGSEKEEVRGLSISGGVLLNRVLREEYGLRTSNLSDVEQIKKANLRENIFDGKYADVGALLKNERGANSYLAGLMIKQTRDLGYKCNNANPLAFNLYDLDLKKDSHSSLGFRIVIRKDAKPFYIPEFSYKHNLERFKRTNENGSPVFDNMHGRRTNYTIKNGLTGIAGVNGWDMHSDVEDLNDYSYEGKVIVVKEPRRRSRIIR